MKIGIAAPVLINSLKDHLVDLNDHELRLGLGGWAVNHLINALLQQGHEVSVYSLDFNISQPVLMKGPHLKVFMGTLRNKARHRMIDFFYRESSQIKEFILADQPDIVNAHWTYEFAIGTIRATDCHLITFRDDAREMINSTLTPTGLANT